MSGKVWPGAGQHLKAEAIQRKRQGSPVCLSNGQAARRKVKLLHGEVTDWRRCVRKEGNYIVTLRG